MEIKKKTIEYAEWPSLNELSLEDQELVAMARNVLPSSYAPYSQFHVAAALRLKNGKVITGTNQENAAYPSGLCAERVAIFAAKHQHPEEEIDTIAITASSDRFKVDHPISPCGSCRQVMLEYELNQSTPIRFILKGEQGKVLIVHSVQTFLPFFFHEDALKK